MVCRGFRQTTTFSATFGIHNDFGSVLREINQPDVQLGPVIKLHSIKKPCIMSLLTRVKILFYVREM